MADTDDSSAARQPLWHSGWLQGAVLAVVALLGGLYYQFVPAVVQTPEGRAVHATSIGLPGADAYYHIRMGYLYRTGEVPAAGTEFRWTRESIWAESFANKDYLFHLYLAPFTVLASDSDDIDGLIIAAKVATAVLVMLVTLTLFVVMRRLGVRGAAVLALGLAAVGGSVLVFRYGMCRSYLLSVILALVGWLLIVQGRYFALLLVAALYTLAYTASHLLLALVVMQGITRVVLGPERRLHALRNLGLFGAAAGGIALGVILHPHSANLVQHWWVQNVVVLALAQEGVLASVVGQLNGLFGLDIEMTPPTELQLGMELNAPKGRAMFLGAPLLMFAPMVLPLLAAWARWRPSREALLVSVPALAMLLAYSAGVRFIEYAAPFMTLAIGVWATGLLQSRGYRAWLRRSPRRAGSAPVLAALALVLASGLVVAGSSHAYRITHRGDVAEAGRWLHQNPEAHGKVVWHDRWDDFTQLFFYAPECDYLVGLDPTFFYVRDPERYALWTDIRRGERREFLDDIRETFGASYVLANRTSSEFFYSRLHDYAHQGRLELVVRGEDDRWSLYRIVR
jgi:hypothetical protein